MQYLQSKKWMKLSFFHRYIALFFLGVFTFPVVFLYFHSFHHLEEREHSEKEYNQVSNAVYFFEKYGGDEDCPVCDYEFFLQHTPLIYRKKSTVCHGTVLKQYFAVSDYSRTSKVPPSLRAPPSFTT